MDRVGVEVSWDVFTLYLTWHYYFTILGLILAPFWMAMATPQFWEQADPSGWKVLEITNQPIMHTSSHADKGVKEWYN